MNNFFIGIDIGGTNVRAGVTDADGNLLDVVKCLTGGAKNAEGLFEMIAGLVESLPHFEQAAAIGCGVPGMVENNQITTCRNIKFLKDYPLQSKLVARFGKPVLLQNDAKLAALGEALAGAGKKYNAVAYAGLGTGLGGGAVIDKKIYLGAGNLGGYFSRMILDGENIAENLVSGSALARLGGLGDAEVLKAFKKNLVVLLLNISVTLNPDAIVLGGGVMKSADLFFDEVIGGFKAQAHPAAKNTAIIKAALTQSGVTGAALYAKNGR